MQHLPGGLLAARQQHQHRQQGQRGPARPESAQQTSQREGQAERSEHSHSCAVPLLADHQVGELLSARFSDRPHPPSMAESAPLLLRA
ncbi:MAG: hypothetical protein ACKOPS_08165, partial [Cyanobium sp.]